MLDLHNLKDVGFKFLLFLNIKLQVVVVIAW